MAIPSLNLQSLQQNKSNGGDKAFQNSDQDDSKVMRTQIRAVLAEHVVRNAESLHKTERRGVLELSWDNESRDLAQTIQSSLECVCIRGQSATGQPRTTMLSINPVSIKTVSRESKDKSIGQAAAKASSKPKKEGRAAPRDFQDEFMGKYNEFSQSWRDLIDKGKRF